MSDFDPKDFVRERNAAFRSLDIDKIKAYARKYGAPLPSNDTVLLAGVHKARMQVTTFTAEEKAVSAAWLQTNNYTIPEGVEP